MPQFEPPAHYFWSEVRQWQTLKRIYHADNLYLADYKHFQWIPVTDFWRWVYHGLKVWRHMTSMLRREWLIMKLVWGVIIAWSIYKMLEVSLSNF